MTSGVMIYITSIRMFVQAFIISGGRIHRQQSGLISLFLFFGNKKIRQIITHKMTMRRKGLT
jgi:hypothetical protein